MTMIQFKAFYLVYSMLRALLRIGGLEEGHRLFVETEELFNEITEDFWGE